MTLASKRRNTGSWFGGARKEDGDEGMGESMPEDGMGGV